ncbi:MAG: YigZ family protein [Chryseobacterium sp.]|nr:MAG: YigZ family protein [Chryseobacterium sp.]
MEFEFLSIRKPVEDVVLREKGSRFLNFAYPVRNETEIKDRLAHLRNLHPKANHHCYAYRLGTNGEQYRANDDGEPNGSAGLPIYNQLLAHDVTNILLVSVRYFGGIKLGVGGLVRAYKESAKMCLQEAEIVRRELQMSLEVTFDFAQQNSIFTLLNRYDAKIINFEAAQQCLITALVRAASVEELCHQLSELRSVDFEIKED